MAALLLVFDYAHPCPIGLWPRCLFICHHINALLLMVLVADSRGITLTTVSRWAGRPGVRSGSPLVHWKGAGLQALPRKVLGHAHVSYVIPGRDGVRYINHGFGWCTSLRNCLVTGSLLFAAPVRSGIVLCLPRVLTKFLWWTVVNASRIKSDTWWMCNMASGTDRPGADGAGGDFPVQGPVS